MWGSIFCNRQGQTQLSLPSSGDGSGTHLEGAERAPESHKIWLEKEKFPCKVLNGELGGRDSNILFREKEYVNVDQREVGVRRKRGGNRSD